MSCLALLLFIAVIATVYSSESCTSRLLREQAEQEYKRKMSVITHITIRHTDTYMRNTPSANKEMFNGCPLIVDELWKHNLRVEEWPLRVTIPVVNEEVGNEITEKFRRWYMAKVFTPKNFPNTYREDLELKITFDELYEYALEHCLVTNRIYYYMVLFLVASGYMLF